MIMEEKKKRKVLNYTLQKHINNIESQDNRNDMSTHNDLFKFMRNLSASFAKKHARSSWNEWSKKNLKAI